VQNKGNGATPVATRKPEKVSAPPVLGLMESFTQNTSLPFRAVRLFFIDPPFKNFMYAYFVDF